MPEYSDWVGIQGTTLDDSPPPTASTGCDCGDDWRVEATDLRTGIVKAVLSPLSADWETILNGFGQGSLTLATKDIRIQDIWPHSTGVFITRVAGGSATSASPVCEFAGYIEKVTASDNGTTMVGMRAIEDYLNHRMITTTADFENVDQNVIGAGLVQQAQLNGIPLTASSDASAQSRIRHYPSWDRKIIGEAIQELTQVINGNDWVLTSSRTAQGAWSSNMRFTDLAGSVRADTLKSDREAAGYSLDVDAAGHATYVDAIGSGEEELQLIAHAEDTLGLYPRFDAAPAWKDVSEITTLESHAAGYLDDYKDPVALPTAVVRGLDPDPDRYQLGDTVNVDINYGAVTYLGPARIIGRAWSFGASEPASRSYALYPVTRASESVYGQTAEADCEGC